MKIGTVVSAPGTLAKGTVEIGRYPDGPINSPVMVAEGRKPGPALFITCLVHGTEIIGPLGTDTEYIYYLAVDAAFSA